jgi:peptide/nickel transport system substrate-binding protein
MRSIICCRGAMILRAGQMFVTRLTALAFIAVAVTAGAPANAESRGQLTIAAHISLAPTWFDPAETSGIITPYLVMYALHDAMAKPMPAGNTTPSLAESWAVSEVFVRALSRRGACDDA